MHPRLATWTLGLLALATPGRAQVPPVSGTVPLTPVPGDVDNTKGNWFDFETSPVAPILVDPWLNAYLVAPNQPSMRLSVFYLPTNTMVGEIPTGPGIVSLALRPNTTELWGVDSVTHSVVVLDVVMNTIARTIPVGKEPHGIAFLPDGSKAYVACSASDRVDVIDATTYSVVGSVATVATGGTNPLYLSGPHAVAYQSGRIWVSALRSGNNTVATANSPAGLSTQRVISVASIPGANQLPDHDVLAIDPATDTVDGTRTVTGAGTILLNLHARPNSDELWIPNTEALNAQFRGEKNFVGGQVVSNRITIVDALTGQISTVVDLDGLVAGLGFGGAQPAAIAFGTDYAFVAAYGSDRVLALEAATGALKGEYHVPPSTSATRSGPRGLWVGANGQELFVYNKADNSYSRIDLSAGAVFGGTPTATVPLGYDPTPDAVKRGRGHLINADHSASRTSSCASCHVDGNHDGLMWELSKWLDPAGTPSGSLTFEKDVKGPMATQSLRGLFEAGPYHWRGEQRTLDAFNGAFVGLLKRSAPLSTSEFEDLKEYVFSLVYRSNPRQDVSRAYPGNEGAGLTAFKKPGVTCSGCHTLPLGSSLDLQLSVSGPPSHSMKVAQLRGVGDKLGPSFFVDNSLGGLPADVGNRTATGFGLLHAGAVSSLLAFVQAPIFPHLNSQEQQDVATFLSAFDTGLAPATSFQRTFLPSDPNLAATIAAAQTYLSGQLGAGNCDVVLYGTTPNGGGGGLPFGAAYDHTTGNFQYASAGTQLPWSWIQTYVQSTSTPVTVVGLPPGAAWRFGIDRDHDALLDFDEYGHGTSPFLADFDADGLPDGHEVANGSNPLTPTTPSPDQTAPQFTSPIQVTWTTTNGFKLEFSTDEPTQASLEIGGTPVTTATPSPKDGGFDVNHAIVVNQQQGGLSATATVIVVDPAGNKDLQTVPVSTLGRSWCARVSSIQFGAFSSGVLPVTVTLDTLNPAGPASTYAVEAFAYLDIGGTLSVIGQQLSATTASNGTATFNVPIPGGGPVNGRRLHFGVRHAAAPIVPPPGTQPPPYVEAEDVENFDTSPLF